MEERHGWVLATFLQRLAAHLIDTVLFHLPLLVIILTLVGSILIGIEGGDPKPPEDNGEPSGWGYTFLREFVIKGLLGGFLSGMTGGIYFAAAHLWPLWDRDRQALHDKMIGTLVVQNRR